MKPQPLKSVLAGIGDVFRLKLTNVTKNIAGPIPKPGELDRVRLWTNLIVKAIGLVCITTGIVLFVMGKIDIESLLQIINSQQPVQP